MADFTGVQAKINSVHSALGVPERFKSVYQACKGVRDALALYTAGTDPTFNATLDALLTTPQKQELSQMITLITPLLTDWEANHSWVTQ